MIGVMNVPKSFLVGKYYTQKNNIVGKRKVFLMIKGLQKIKEEKKDISQNIFLLGGKYSEVSEEIKESLPKMII